MPRQRRVLSETGIYHILLRGNERKHIFSENVEKQRFLEDVAVKQRDIGFSLYAYCVMDNHVHILLNTNEKDLSTIMKGIAVRYASFYNAKHRRVGHVFQDRFKSEPIEDERYLLAVIRYIHNNPVKAGMVEKPEGYPWSSYPSFMKAKSSRHDLVDTEYILGMVSKNRKEAIQEFKRFSVELDESVFLDCDNNEIRTPEEGQEYLAKYLEEHWADRGIEAVIDDIKTRGEIIAHLRSNTKLSIRTIAALLGVDRNVVARVRGENKAHES